MGMMNFEKITPLFEKVDNTKELPPVQKESVDGWRKIPIHECEEKLVPVGAFSEFSNCDTSAVYFGERGVGTEKNFLGKEVDREVSLITHFVREGVLKKLKVAQGFLPKGYYFRFLDNYRSVQVQQALYDEQREKFRNDHSEWDEVRLEEETQKYVSLPSPNKERGTTHPSPHSTGAVVDLTIIKMSDDGERLLKELDYKKFSGKLNYPIGNEEKGELGVVEKWIENEAEMKGWDKKRKKFVQDNWLSSYRYSKEKAGIFKNHTSSLNMGTAFDHFGQEAGTRYLEDVAEKRELTENEKEVLQNRRFLYHVMKKVGFSNYPDEWWHWSYGDNMDAVNSKKEHAIYGGVMMSDENMTFEKTRRGQYFDSISRIGKKGLFVDSVEKDPIKIAI